MMSQVKNTRRVEANEAMAICHSIRTSSRKLNLVAQSIRGMNAAKAIAELSFSKKRIAKVALAVLQSAIANAENNHKLNIDKLVVKEAYVGKGIVMKRMHARGRGRGARVLKPFSNMTVVVAERGE
jgi:large subunit ribosomal protein L22